jgi:hypothetical protein
MFPVRFDALLCTFCELDPLRIGCGSGPGCVAIPIFLSIPKTGLIQRKRVG